MILKNSSTFRVDGCECNSRGSPLVMPTYKTPKSSGVDNHNINAMSPTNVSERLPNSTNS